MNGWGRRWTSSSSSMAGPVRAELRRRGSCPTKTRTLLTSDEAQHCAEHPLTPALSPEYGGEGAQLPPLPRAGEGWGEGLLRHIASRETACSTLAGWSGVSTPTRRIKRCSGTVTRPCESKAPGLRNLTGEETSNREPRTLVVCGTSETRDRSGSWRLHWPRSAFSSSRNTWSAA